MLEFLALEDEGRGGEDYAIECEGTLQLSTGTEWTLGKSDTSEVPHDLNELVARELCGWDILSPSYGKECVTYPESQVWFLESEDFDDSDHIDDDFDGP